MGPRVSIIVPVYNCETYISKCLESIISQNYINIEIVIINDGSNDQSEKIINTYKEKDDRIFYYYQKNQGPSEARNNGIKYSTGEYIIFVDADDTVEENYTECLLNTMLISGADLVCCGYKDISAYGVSNFTDFHFENNISLPLFIDMVCKGTGGVLWSKIYKKEIITRHKLKMDKKIFMSEDLVFVLQYASHCKSFASSKEYLYNYNRLNESSISSNISMDYIQNYIIVCKHMEKILKWAKLDEHKMNELLSKRIQEIVFNLVEQQSADLRYIGMENAVYNIKNILSIYYVERYVNRFSTNSYVYKPYLFFLKKRLFKSSILYGFYLNKLRGYKRIMTKRKEVNR